MARKTWWQIDAAMMRRTGTAECLGARTPMETRCGHRSLDDDMTKISCGRHWRNDDGD
jgi:hypothetical protein